MTKYTRLSLAHSLANPYIRQRTPWRAFTLATRLGAVPATGVNGGSVDAAFAAMFDPAAQFVPVYLKQPRRSHIQRY